jgi:hypothetical protein
MMFNLDCGIHLAYENLELVSYDAVFFADSRKQELTHFVRRSAEEAYKVLPQTDVFVLCFCVARPQTVERAKQLAQAAIAASPNAYFVVVGCASDFRESLKCTTNEDDATMVEATAESKKRKLARSAELVKSLREMMDEEPTPGAADAVTKHTVEKKPDEPVDVNVLVTEEMIASLVDSIPSQRVKYLECSAMTNEGVSDVFYSVVIGGYRRAFEVAREQRHLLADERYTSRGKLRALHASVAATENKGTDAFDAVATRATVSGSDSGDDDTAGLSLSMSAHFSSATNVTTATATTASTTVTAPTDVASNGHDRAISNSWQAGDADSESINTEMAKMMCNVVVYVIE